MRILLTGGTGLLGKKLRVALIEKGHEVKIIGRNQTKTTNYLWNIETGYIEPGAMEGIEVIIHLAGASIGEKKWTKRRKNEIIDSRVKSLNLLRKQADYKSLRKVISASGIGYYGYDRNDEILIENSISGDGFLADCCKKWESAAFEFKAQKNIDVCVLRTSMVLSNEGGALEKVIKPIKLNLGSGLGTGKQWTSWIHIDDIVEMYCNSLEDNYTGVINASSPEPLRNIDFIKTIAKAINKKIILPNVPSFFLKTLLGERAQLILGSLKVVPQKLEEMGFKFKYPDLDSAIKEIVSHSK